MTSSSSASTAENLRDRVLEFEREIDERIASLTESEAELISTSSLRQQWLAGVSASVGEDSAVVSKQLELLRAKAELANTQLLVENAKLDAFHEAQTLAYLTAATKPYDDGETAEQRTRALDALVKDNVEGLKEVLSASVARRAGVANAVDELVREVEKLKEEQETSNAVTLKELKGRISKYAAQLRECAAVSKNNYREITGDYLVLRHNTRVAKEILARSQSEASMTRKALEERLQRVKLEAELQKERVTESAAAEIQALTEHIREHLEQREHELEELKQAQEDQSGSQKTRIKELRHAIQMSNARYTDLLEQRTSDMERVEGEVRTLRELVATAEARAFESGGGDNGGADDGFGGATTGNKKKGGGGVGANNREGRPSSAPHNLMATIERLKRR